MKSQVISFPHIGIYHIPIEMLLKRLFPKATLLPPLPTTKRTLELGSLHSPDFVCVPFKYNMGNYIESLEAGATLLLQAGGGCRYGYYGEIQKQILEDLGYDFSFLCFAREDAKPLSIYQNCRAHGSPLSPVQFAKTMWFTSRVIRAMDRISAMVRERIGFCKDPDQLEVAYQAFLKKLPDVQDIRMLEKLFTHYQAVILEIALPPQETLLRVGLVGELYTMMEPFSNFFLEKELARYGMVVDRYIDVSYLLLDKKKQHKNLLQEASPYLHYKIGADGTGTVAKSVSFAKQGYSGIIHLKPFGCTPEINAMPMLQSIAQDYSIPILYFSFDSQTSETGIKTRIEAFCDMLYHARSAKEKELSSCKLAI